MMRELLETLASIVLFFAALAVVLFLFGCTTVATHDEVSVDNATVYVVATPDAAAALICWLDEPLSRCAAVQEEDAK